MLSTTEELEAYLASNYLPNATAAEVQRLLEVYPEDVTQGSPFDTGSQNALTSQYKRLAAFHGDFVFNGPRRFFVQQRSG